MNGEMGTLSSHQGSVDCNIRVYPCLSVVQKSPHAGRVALPLIVVMVLVLPLDIRPKNRINQGLVAFSGLAEIF